MIRDSDEQDNEPPLSGRDTFFPGVPQEEWDDWRWQFRNRITSLQQLARFITAICRIFLPTNARARYTNHINNWLDF